MSTSQSLHCACILAAVFKVSPENAISLLITPTSPTTAFKLGERTKDPMAMYTSDIMTIPANIAGIPGISIPSGKVNGLPVGVQLLGSYFSERKLLSIANHIQKITDWHLDRPDLD